MEKSIKDNLMMYLAIIFVLLACLNVIGLIALDKITVFSFALGSLFFSLSMFLNNKYKGILLSLGLFCVVGLHLLEDSQFILKIRDLLGEDTILLLTIGLSFFNLHLSSLKREKISNKLETEHEKGKKEAIEEITEQMEEQINSEIN